MSAPPPKPPAPPPPKPGAPLPAAPKPAAAPTPAKPPLPPAPQIGQKPAAPPAAPVKEPTYGVIPAIPPKPQTTPVKEPTYGVMPVIQPKPQTTPAAPGAAAGGAKPPIKEPTYLAIPAIAPKPQTTPAAAANAPVKEPTYGVLPIKPGAPPPAQGGSNENKGGAQAAAGGGGGGKSVMGGVGGGQSKMGPAGGGGASVMGGGVRRGPSKGGQSKMGGTVGGTVRKAQSKGGQTQPLMVGGQDEEQEGDEEQDEVVQEVEQVYEPLRTYNDNVKGKLLARMDKAIWMFKRKPYFTKFMEKMNKRNKINPAKTFEEIKPHHFFSYETHNVHYQYRKDFDKKQLEMMIDHDKKVLAEDLERKREITKGLMKGNWRRPVWKERLMQTMVFKIIYLMGLGMTLTFMTIGLIHMSQSASEEFIGIGREDPTIWDLFMVDLEFDLKEGRISDAGWASASLLLAMCIGLSARFYCKEPESKAYATSVLAESRYYHCLALQELRRGDMDTNFEMKVKAQVGAMKGMQLPPGQKAGAKETNR